MDLWLCRACTHSGCQLPASCRRSADQLSKCPVSSCHDLWKVCTASVQPSVLAAAPLLLGYTQYRTWRHTVQELHRATRSTGAGRRNSTHRRKAATPALQAASISSACGVHLPQGCGRCVAMHRAAVAWQWVCSGASLLLQVSPAWWLQCCGTVTPCAK